MCNNAFYPHPVSYFQLHLSGVVTCSDLIVSTVLLSDLIHYSGIHYCHLLMSAGCIASTEQKLEDITSALLKQLTASCAECGISSDIIDEQSFSCFPESPTHVTFRARLGGSSETDSGSLISLLESWVSGGATIIVTGVLMTVDAECSVAISSLSEGECSMTTTQPPDTITPSSTDSTGTPSSDSQTILQLLLEE